MQVQDGVAIEPDMLGPLDQQVDGSLVVQDHLGFADVVAFGGLAEGEQPLRVQQRVGIALEAARVPGKIDQQAPVELARIGTGGEFAIRRVAQGE